MKLEVAVNEAILSNVGTTGEFRIRNSAKAFKILSDGLYSNKIRAIIRELSCNAVDSHVAAGKADVPFEVHLPSAFEPYFAIRDFGLGLNNDQVMNIYTTYFESTKTDSNEFIGALGLGSKSPFSYTENFTVSAIKDGTKRIYSAFINENGVPSVAQMSEELTDESNGVEVKFSVTERSDYYSFKNEAQQVFEWFKLKPTVVGVDFKHSDPDFHEKNIVPGVHAVKHNYHSVAIMGNIPYPLDNIPEKNKHFGELAGLLECGLAIEFDIGELDFAASREQLSYVPLTLNSIKKKLELLNTNLAGHLATKTDAITCLWERACYLYKESQTQLYKSAVSKYVADTKFPLFDAKSYHGRKTFELQTEEMKKRGLEIRGLRVYSHGNQTSKLSEDSHYNAGKTIKYMGIPVSPEVVIVFNDLKVGCVARARYHFRKNNGGKDLYIYVISHEDANNAVRQKEYNKIITELYNPPRIVMASTLEKPPRTTPMSTTGITQVWTKRGEDRGREGSYTWTTYSEEIDEEETYYYVCLDNHQSIDQAGNEINFFRIKAWMDQCGVADISNIRILGVRKNRYKEIKALDNWVWFEDKLKEETAKVTDDHIASLVVSEILDHYSSKVYTNPNVARLVGPDSYYNQFVTMASQIKRQNGNVSQLVELCGKYGKSTQVEAVKKKLNDAKELLAKKYPLLRQLTSGANDKDVADYIKLRDQQEKAVKPNREE